MSNPTPKLARGLNKRLARELSAGVRSRVDEELLLEPVLGDFSIKTEHGLLLGTSEKNEGDNITAAITTFVNNTRLRPDQM